MNRFTVIAALLIVATAPAMLVAANADESPYFQEFTDEPSAMAPQTDSSIADKSVNPPDVQSKGLEPSSASQAKASELTPTTNPKPESLQEAPVVTGSSISSYLSALAPSLDNVKKFLRVDAKSPGPQASWDFRPRW